MMLNFVTSLVFFFFFFSSRRRHTRLTCDWSSDVCSSDLARTLGSLPRPGRRLSGDGVRRGDEGIGAMVDVQQRALGAFEIGRASCRERGVDLGGRRIIKKKKKNHCNSDIALAS